MGFARGQKTEEARATQGGPSLRGHAQDGRGPRHMPRLRTGRGRGGGGVGEKGPGGGFTRLPRGACTSQAGRKKPLGGRRFFGEGRGWPRFVGGEHTGLAGGVPKASPRGHRGAGIEGKGGVCLLPPKSCGAPGGASQLGNTPSFFSESSGRRAVLQDFKIHWVDGWAPSFSFFSVACGWSWRVGRRGLGVRGVGWGGGLWPATCP